MKEFWRRYRFQLTLILVAATALGVLFWVRLTTDAVRAEARERFFDQYNRQQSLMAQSASRTLEESFVTFRRNLDIIVSLYETRGVSVETSRAVDGTLKRIYASLSNRVIDMVVFDKHGMAVAMEPVDPYTMSHSYAWREYYKLARDKKLNRTMYLSPFMRLEGGRFRGDNALIVAQGIYTPRGEFDGVAIFALDFNDLLAKCVRPLQIGKRGRAWLVDNNNRTVLLEPTGTMTGRHFEEALLPKWPDLFRLMSTTCNGIAGNGRYYFDDPERPGYPVRKLVSYHPVRIAGRLWTLGVATPEREAEAQLSVFLDRQERFATTLLVTVLAGATLLLGLLYNWNRMLSAQVAGRTRELSEARTNLESTFDELLMIKKVAAVGRLALGLVHEIRNPLSAIQMNMQMIRKRIGTSGQLQENFAIVEGEILRLNGLLKEVQAFARHRPLRLELTELTPLVHRLIQLLSHRLEEQGIAVEFQLEPISLVCDPEQLHQVLLNLVLNAAEAMQESERRHVLIAAWTKNDLAVIQVTDSGPGIASEQAEQLFDPFVTSKAAGGGLGLSIVQTIVLRHGGAVVVDSEPGEGATFIVTLPMMGPSQQE